METDCLFILFVRRVKSFDAVEPPSCFRIEHLAIISSLQGGQHDSNGICGSDPGFGFGFRGRAWSFARGAGRSASGGSRERGRVRSRYSGLVRLALPSLALASPLLVAPRLSALLVGIAAR